MMNYNSPIGFGGGFDGTFGVLSQIVWLAVGILAAIWLWKQISH